MLLLESMVMRHQARQTTPSRWARMGTITLNAHLPPLHRLLPVDRLRLHPLGLLLIHHRRAAILAHIVGLLTIVIAMKIHARLPLLLIAIIITNIVKT